VELVYGFKFAIFEPNKRNMAKILVVDDEVSIRRALKNILENENYSVDLAENGEQALEMTSAESYDVILLDIKMPGMDGMEVLDKLIETTETCRTFFSPHTLIGSTL
jgi:CheY-like chemotaxis protein